MEHKRTLTMSWDGLGEEDDDDFFESRDRLSTVRFSTVNPGDFLSTADSDDEVFEDGRLSFVSTIPSTPVRKIYPNSPHEAASPSPKFNHLVNYDMWMSDPGDINERRKRLLQGMGLTSSKELSKLASAKFVRTISTKIDQPAQDSSKSDDHGSQESLSSKEELQSVTTQIVLVRSRSDADILPFAVDTKKRKEEMIGAVSKQRLTRTSTVLMTHSPGFCHLVNAVNLSPNRSTRNRSSSHANNGMFESTLSKNGIGSFFLIKNLDTGKEFVVKEYNELSDLQTGKQLTMDEFEKSVGYSPVVRELMHRENVSKNNEDGKKTNGSSYLSKSLRDSKRMGAALLKNLTHSMSGLIAEKERDTPISPRDRKPNKNPSKWIRVRHYGRSYKEFTAMYKSQEIQAHEGSIWTIKFSPDSNYLATAGEDKVIHVWEVQECEVMTARPIPDDLNSNRGTSVHSTTGDSTCPSPVNPMARINSYRPPLAEIPPLSSRKKGKTNKKKGNTIPDYVNVPETVFSLSENPVCTFKGHLEDVLDLSWSSTQLLLSSSMDKTVRLWDMQTKSCLKMFAHNDYVTCIHFNPVDDDYFISGSLDGKIRIWNVPNRQVVDWMDLHEMVTAAHYTPDGQGAIIGSHKGSCRQYTISDSKLEYKDLIEVQTKKSQAKKKITGFEFSKSNQDEVLITSADSRIRILDGSDLIHKFRGFRNTSSQISASFSPDGKYVMSASEDSQVYIWKREEPRNTGTAKGKTMISCYSYEHFQCKDVSVAVPWPGSIKNDPPIVEIHSKKYHSKRSSHPPPYPTTSGGSPNREENNITSSVASNRKHLPPLARRDSGLERSRSCQEDEISQSSHMDDAIMYLGSSEGEGDSFVSACSSSVRSADSSSFSASGSSPPPTSSSSWSIFDNSGNTSNTIQATAWGSVIVTASLGGEIRVYQNFGLPLKVTGLFRDLT
ncbi:hypothetical protein Leryth_018163 [Lithospermum erythrorhizon]|nr:hypothetical protein Leryth_018163 [Lithospermum erythrorhizon]